MGFMNLKRIAYREGVTLMDLGLLLNDWGGRLFRRVPLDRAKNLTEGKVRVLYSDDIRYNFAFPNPLIEPKVMQYSPSILKGQMLTSHSIILPSRSLFSGVAWYTQIDKQVTVLPYNTYSIDTKNLERSVRLFLWLNRREVIDSIIKEQGKKVITISFIKRIPIPVKPLPEDIVNDFLVKNNQRIQLLSGVDALSNSLLEMSKKVRYPGKVAPEKSKEVL